MRTIILTATLLLTTSMVAQTITQPFTPEQYVNEVLVEEGVMASNVTFSGGNDQIGLVTNAAVALGMPGGVMLNTDHVSCTSTCTNCGGLQSDADLESVANSVPPLIGQTFWLARLTTLRGWNLTLSPMGIAFRSITCSGPTNT